MNNNLLVAKNTLWQIAARAVMIVCSLLAAYFLTRSLGTEIWGNYVFITNVILMAFNLADFGSGTITVKKLAQNNRSPKEKNLIIRQSLSLKIVFTSITLALLAILASSLTAFQGLRSLTLLASLAIILLSLRSLAEAFFMAESNFIAKTAFEVIASLAFLGGIILFKISGQPISLTQTVAIWLTSTAISAIMAIAFLIRETKIKLSPAQNNLKKFLSQAAPVGIRQLVFALYDAGIDSFFLKVLIGSTAVGFYGLAYKIYTNLILGAAFFMNSLFPLIVKNHQSHLNQTLKKGGLFLIITGILLASLLIIFSPAIIGFLGGESFGPSVVILRILSLALIFSYLNHLTGYTMIALGKQKQLLYFSLIALIINLAGNWLFIPQTGARAAAWVTVATEAAILFMTGIFLVKKLQLKFK